MICKNEFLNKLNKFHERVGMKWFYLVAVLTIAFLLRFINLERIPLGFWQDEGVFGYNAYSILKTGRAENGDFLPVFFKVWGGREYSNGVLYYFLVPFIKLFGPSIFAIRFATCCIGLLTIFFTYKLIELYFNKSCGLLSVFLLAISPWHIQFSRIAMDPVLLPLFHVFGFYIFSLGLKKNKAYIIYSCIPIGLSFYCYGVARLFVPLFYFFVLFLNFQSAWSRKKELVICLISITLILFPFIKDFKTIQDTRFALLSITNEYFSLNPMKEKLKNSNLSFLISNKLTLTVTIFVQNYFKHISADFLLINGSSNLREHVGGRGQLLWFTFWMGIIGFFVLIFGRNYSLYIFPIWFLIFPIPASLTWEGIPHAGRCICGLPVFEILAGIGFFSFLSTANRLLDSPYKLIAQLVSLTFLLIIINGVKDFNSYLKDYFSNYQLRSTGWYNYDIYAISQATQSMKEFDEILVPPWIDYVTHHTSILFLQKIDPKDWLDGKYKFKYVPSYVLEPNSCNKKIARVVQPGSYPNEETIGYVNHEITKQVMYEVKKVSPLSVCE